MRTLRLLSVAALLIFLASAARADDINIIYDPTIPPPPPSSGPYNIVTPTGGPYTVSWVPCSEFSLQYTAPALYTYLMNNAGDSPTACMGFMNGTGQTINYLDLVVTSSVEGGGITCTSLDTTLPNNDCTGDLSPGTPSEVDFYGTLGIPYDQPPPDGTGLTQFFFAEIGVDASNLTTTIMVPTHDPNTLILLLAGIAMLAMGGMRRYYA